jgi:hypothetical protein
MEMADSGIVTLCTLTLAEAEAWRAGWRAAREAAARLVVEDRHANRRPQLQAAIRAMDPPA